MQAIRTRLEKAKVAKALGERRRLLNSNPEPNWQWVEEMLKML